MLWKINFHCLHNRFHSTSSNCDNSCFTRHIFEANVQEPNEFVAKPVIFLYRYSLSYKNITFSVISLFCVHTRIWKCTFDNDSSYLFTQYIYMIYAISSREKYWLNNFLKLYSFRKIIVIKFLLIFLCITFFLYFFCWLFF